jgi:hypothetical protein
MSQNSSKTAALNQGSAPIETISQGTSLPRSLTAFPNSLDYEMVMCPKSFLASLNVPSTSSQSSSQRAPCVSSSSSQPSSEQLASLLAVPSGMMRELVRDDNKSRKGRKGKRRDANIAFGNDDIVPFTRTLQDRSSVTIVGTVTAAQLVASSTVASTFAGYYFQGNYIENFSAMSGVFDEYHIVEIECIIFPTVTEVTSVATWAGNYVTCVDIDDAGTPTGLDQVNSYPSSLNTSGTVSHYHRWSPQYAVATYSGAFTAYSAARGWVDCSSPTVQWYGIKFGAPISTVAQSYFIMSRMKVAFRGLH